MAGTALGDPSVRIPRANEPDRQAPWVVEMKKPTVGPAGSRGRKKTWSSASRGRRGIGGETPGELGNLVGPKIVRNDAGGGNRGILGTHAGISGIDTQKYPSSHPQSTACKQNGS